MIFLQYTWLFGWFGDTRERDLKINVICPATDVHVRKVNSLLFYILFEYLNVEHGPVHEARASHCPRDA